MPISTLEGCRLRESAVGMLFRVAAGRVERVFDCLVRNIPAAEGQEGWVFSIDQRGVVVDGVIVEPDHHAERLVTRALRPAIRAGWIDRHDKQGHRAGAHLSASNLWHRVCALGERDTFTAR